MVETMSKNNTKEQVSVRVRTACICRTGEQHQIVYSD